MLSDDLVKGARGAFDYCGGLVPLRTLYHYTETGVIPVHRVGRSLFYSKQDLRRVFGGDLVAEPKAA